MARRLEYEISTDASKGIKGLKDFSAAAKKELKAATSDLEETATAGERVAKVLTDMAGTMETEMRQAAAAAEALAQALGPEIASRADLDQIVSDLNRMGLSFDEITADADKLATSLKELDRVQMGGVQDGLTRTRTATDDVAGSADSAKGALANMVGNAAQDLGALGGVAGSAGVAIGQMAEYMADAKLKGEGFGSVVSSFGKVALPIAGIGATVAVIANYFAELAETRAFNTERVEEFNEALKDTKVTSAELMDILAGEEDTGILVRIGDETTNVDRAVSRTLGTFSDFNTLVAEGQKGVDGYADGLVRQGKAVGLGADKQLLLNKAVEDAKDGTLSAASAGYARIVGMEDEIFTLTALGSTQKGVTDGAKDLAFQQQFYGDATEESTEATDAQNKALQDQIDLYGTAATAIVSLVRAHQILDEPISIEAAVQGASDLVSEMFALRNISSNYEAALDSLNKSLTDNGATFDLNTDAGRANEAALQQLAGSLVPEIGANYEQAAGSLEAFATAQADTARRLRQSLIDNGVAAAEADAIVQRLLPLDGKSIETQYRLIGEADAQTKVNQLLTLIGDLELAPDIEKEIALAIADGKGPQDVLTLIEQALDEPVGVPTEVEHPTNTREVVSDTQDTLDALKLTIPASVRVTSSNLKQYLASIGALDAGGTAKGVGGIAGERGPEIVDGRYLVTGPTYVPPGTRVTSRRQTAVILRNGGTRGLKRYDSGGVVGGPQTVNINVNAAVVGNRWDVMRTIERGLRDRTRLLGTRH